MTAPAPMRDLGPRLHETPYHDACPRCDHPLISLLGWLCEALEVCEACRGRWVIDRWRSIEAAATSVRAR